MDSLVSTKQAITGSDAILSEILSVLKSINSHLEHQEQHISDLDSKLTKLTLSSEDGKDSKEGFLTSHPPGEKGKQNHPLPTPALRQRDLNTSNSQRNDSVDFRNNTGWPAGWPATPFGEDNNPFSQKTPPRIIPNQADHGKRGIPESPKARNASVFKFSAVSRAGTWNSLTPPPSALGGGYDEDEEIIESHDLSTYAKYPPPEAWIITRSQGRSLDVKFGSQEAQLLWTSYVKDSWTIPPDGRIEMTFQQHILERLNETQAVLLLGTLRGAFSKLEYRGAEASKRGSFRVKDYDFDPDYELSVAEYRADIPIGQIRKHRIKERIKGDGMNVSSAPWKRIIEVKGLSRKLIENEEHEIWTSGFRNPWNEALPIVNTICPFLTNRISSHTHGTFTGMRTVDQALLYHQKCWRRQPPCDDNLCFHITFYELVDLEDEDELEGELWRSGKLHSDNELELRSKYNVKCRRMRESACTIVTVPDTHSTQYWTILYMCPNTFQEYDKDNTIEGFETASAAFKDRDAAGALDIMIEFSLRMVIHCWDKIIGDYFAWLIGHRDTLSDPNAHDSLLFDDDSFSRSRKYFWAINYLAELDISISENIVQAERFVKSNKILQQQLMQLEYLRRRLRDQRNEAIALRDGLFSASGVMESRASTRLGENIKLLTFVSIFFLPLSFCVSIWSINDNLFSLRSLLISVFLVGASTYFVVFNLGTFASVLASIYSKQKFHLIDQMKASADQNWRSRGKRFVIFQRKSGHIKPSEWMVGLFLMHKLFGKFRLRETAESNGGDGMDENIARGKRAVPMHDTTSWQDQELPPELREEPHSVEGPKVRKAPSFKDSFVRLGRVFTGRRNAIKPPQGNATLANV